jgi:hypothetical protein
MYLIFIAGINKEYLIKSFNNNKIFLIKSGDRASRVNEPDSFPPRCVDRGHVAD